MIVTQVDDFIFAVELNPSEIEALQREVTNPPDWDVKDVASFIRHILVIEVDSCKLRHNL